MVRHTHGGASAPSNVVAFPKSVVKGRKRAAGGSGSCGDIALMILERDGYALPRNVERLAGKEPVSDLQLMKLLAFVTYASLPPEQQKEVRKQVRVLKYDGYADAELVAAAVELDRVLVPHTTFIRESDGKRFNIKGEPL